MGNSTEHAEYAFLYVELEVEVTADDDDDVLPYAPLARVTWSSVMQLRNAAKAVDAVVAVPDPPPNGEPVG